MPTFDQAAGKILDVGLGLALEKHQDNRQIRQQERLNQQQFNLDIRRLSAGKAAELEQWKQTGPVGQMEQLKKAGLNPGLIYGMGGAGGQTTGTGSAGGGAPSAPQGGGEIMSLNLARAQQGLIEAQTRNIEADTTKKTGVDTKEAETRIESLTAGIENTKAATRLTALQGDIKEIETMMQGETYEDVVTQIRYSARKAGIELALLKNEKTISDKTINEKVGLVQGELIGLGLANELKRTQIKLTEEQTKKVVADVAQGWKNLSIQERNAAIAAMNSETARQNANTNVRNYLENVRQHDNKYEVETAKLALAKLIKDVPDSDKMSVEMISNVLGNLARVLQKED